jgi:RNA polymerase sigma factor (sigma-70 family)
MMDADIIQIRRLALRLALRSRLSLEDAEDFANDMVVKFLDIMDKYDPSKASLITWAYSIIMSGLRESRRRERSQSRGHGLLVDCDDDDLSNVPTLRRNRPAAHIPTAHLTPAAAQLIEYVLATGSVTEAASSMGISTKTARRRLQRLKQK